MAVPPSIIMRWRVSLWVQDPLGSHVSFKKKMIGTNIFVSLHMECIYIHIGAVLRFSDFLKHLMTTKLCQIACILFNIIKLKEMGTHRALS
jgi:hypothetical protein